VNSASRFYYYGKIYQSYIEVGNMNNRGEVDLDALVGNFIAGYLGYVAGSRKFSGWESIIKNYETRMTHLAYFKIFRPESFFISIPTSLVIYRQAVLAYLFGLPDASIPTSLRCLEIGLTFKYVENTGQPPPQRNKLFTLIDWAESYLGRRKEIAHGFRILRNLIHEPPILSEQDALDALFHITRIINLVYTLPEYARCGYHCERCNTNSEMNVPIQECFLGNVIYTTYCATCSQPTPVLVI
jgi:hypothetical protein